MEDQAAGLRGVHGQLAVRVDPADAGEGRLVGIGAGELAAVGGGLVGLDLHPGRLAVFKEEQQRAGVVSGQHGEHHVLLAVHAQLGGQIVAQHAGLGVVEVADAGLVHLTLVGEEHDLRGVGGLESLAQAVAVLELLLAVHAQRGGRDLLEIALPGQEDGDGVILHHSFFLVLLDLVAEHDGGAAGLTVLFRHLVQLVDDDLFHPLGIIQDLLQIVDLIPQGIRLPGALEDVFLVDVAQLDLRHILRLNLVDTEADHQVGDDLGLLLRLADDADGLVDIQQDPLEALQQMQLLFALAEDEIGAAADGLRTPSAPLLQHLAHTQHLGAAGDEHVEVAGEGVLQGRLLIELGHQLVGIGTPLQIDGQLQTGQVGLVAHVGDFLGLAGLDQLRHLVQNGLHRGGVGDLIDLNEVLCLDIAVLGPHPHAAAAGLIDLPQSGRVADQVAAGGKIRRQQRFRQVTAGIFQIGDGGLADLPEIEAAELGGHAHGDAAVGRHQNVGERSGQQGGFLHGIVVVIHEVHGVAVDIPEQLAADGHELGFRVTGSGPGHVAGKCLAEVALGVHKGRQQGAVAAGQTHHGVIDGRVAVGIQAHGLTHDVGGLGAVAGHQAHFVHGVQQLPVGGLEAVDLRNGPGHDGRHGIGHEVGLQRAGDGLLHHRRMQPHDIGIIDFLPGFLRLFLSGH